MDKFTRYWIIWGILGGIVLGFALPLPSSLVCGG